MTTTTTIQTTRTWVHKTLVEDHVTWVDPVVMAIRDWHDVAADTGMVAVRPFVSVRVETVPLTAREFEEGLAEPRFAYLVTIEGEVTEHGVP